MGERMISFLFIFFLFSFARAINLDYPITCSNGGPQGASSYIGCFNYVGFNDIGVTHPRRNISVSVYDSDSTSSFRQCLLYCGSVGYQYSGLTSGVFEDDISNARCYCFSEDEVYGDSSYFAPVEESYCNISCVSDTFQCGGPVPGGPTSIYKIDEYYLGCWTNTSMLYPAPEVWLSQDITSCYLYCATMGFSFAVMQQSGCSCAPTYGAPGLSPSYTNDVYTCAGSNVFSVPSAYLGCYTVNTDDSEFTFEVTMAGLAVDDCVISCASNGFAFASIYNQSCRCGNTYGANGRFCPEDSDPECATSPYYSTTYCNPMNHACGPLEVESCGGEILPFWPQNLLPASIYSALSPHGFSVYNFLGAEKGGPVGRNLSLSGDARLGTDYLLTVTTCQNSLISKGGIWTVPLQPTNVVFDASFQFANELCGSDLPTGNIALIFQKESYHATVFPYSDTSIVGIPEAFVVMASLLEGNQSFISIFNTDCNGLTVTDSLITINITGILGLYTPNLITLENNRNNTAYYDVSVNGQYLNNSFLASNYNFLGTSDNAAYMGVGAVSTNAQFFIMSMDMNNCGLERETLLYTPDGFNIVCSNYTYLDWYNRRDKSGVIPFSPASIISVNVQQPFSDDAIYQCFDESFNALAQQQDIPDSCYEMTTQGILYFNFPMNNSYADTVNITLTDISLSSSNWLISGTWSWWNVSNIIMQNVLFVGQTLNAGFSNLVFLPAATVNYNMSASGTTTEFFSSDNSIPCSVTTQFSSTSLPSEFVVNLDYVFDGYVSINAAFALPYASMTNTSFVSCPDIPVLFDPKASASVFFGDAMIFFNPLSFQFDPCANTSLVSAYQASAFSVDGTQFCFDGINCSSSAVSLQIYSTQGYAADGYSLSQATFALQSNMTTYGQFSTINAVLIPHLIFNQTKSVLPTIVSIINLNLTTDLFVANINLNYSSLCGAPIYGSASITSSLGDMDLSVSGANVSFYACAVTNSSINDRVWTITGSTANPSWTIANFTVSSVEVIIQSPLLQDGVGIDFNVWELIYNSTVIAWGGRHTSYLVIEANTTAEIASDTYLLINYAAPTNTSIGGVVYPTLTAFGYVDYSNSGDCSTGEPGSFDIFNLVLLNQAVDFAPVPFQFYRCESESPAAESGVMLISSYNVINNTLQLPGDLVISSTTISFSANAAATGNQIYDDLSDFISWTGVITLDLASVFDNVTIEFDSTNGINSMIALDSSDWSSIVQSNIIMPLNDTEFVPSWGQMDVTFVAVPGSNPISLPGLTIGYMAQGWNFNFHQDGTIELPSPPKLFDSTFSVYVPDTENVMYNIHFAWEWPTIFSPNFNETVYWGNGTTNSTAQHTFATVSDSYGQVLPSFIAISPLFSTELVIANYTYTSYTVQMMGYVTSQSANTSNLFWEGRIIGQTTDENTVIVEFNSNNVTIPAPLLEIDSHSNSLLDLENVHLGVTHHMLDQISCPSDLECPPLTGTFKGPIPTGPYIIVSKTISNIVLYHFGSVPLPVEVQVGLDLCCLELYMIGYQNQTTWKFLDLELSQINLIAEVRVKTTSGSGINITGLDWGTYITAVADVPSIGFGLGVSFGASISEGVQEVEVQYTQTIPSGNISLTVEYNHNSSCSDVDGFSTFGASGTLFSSLSTHPSNNSFVFDISGYFDYCSKTWQLNGNSGLSMPVHGFTINNISVFLTGTKIGNTTTWDITYYGKCDIFGTSVTAYYNTVTDNFYFNLVYAQEKAPFAFNVTLNYDPVNCSAATGNDFNGQGNAVFTHNVSKIDIPITLNYSSCTERWVAISGVQLSDLTLGSLTITNFTFGIESDIPSNNLQNTSFIGGIIGYGFVTGQPFRVLVVFNSAGIMQVQLIVTYSDSHVFMDANINYGEECINGAIASGNASVYIPSLLGSSAYFNAFIEVPGNCSTCNVCTNGTSCVNSTICVNGTYINGTDCINGTTCTNCTASECPTPPVWIAGGYVDVKNGKVLNLPFESSVLVQFAKYANTSYLQGKFIVYTQFWHLRALMEAQYSSQYGIANAYVSLQYFEPTNLFLFDATLNWTNPRACEPTSAQGTLQLNRKNSTDYDLLQLTGAYYNCATNNSKEWEIVAFTANELKVAGILLTNATFTLYGVKSIGFNGTERTLWAGSLKGFVFVSGFELDVSMDFDMQGFSNIVISGAVHTEAFDINLSLVYEKQPNCTGIESDDWMKDSSTASLVGYDASTFHGSRGNGTFELKKIGTGLSMDVDIVHDLCADIWYFNGGINKQWNISEFTLDSLRLSLLAQPEFNKTGYVWSGAVYGAASVGLFDSNLTVAASFNPLGLEYVDIIVYQEETFGTIDVAIHYANSNQTAFYNQSAINNQSTVNNQSVCHDGMSKYLSLEGSFVSSSISFRADVSYFYVTGTYDLCSKHLRIDGNTSIPMPALDLVLDYGKISVDGTYNSTSHSWTWYHIIASGEITLAGVTVDVDIIRLDIDNVPTLFINSTAEYGTIGVDPVVLDLELQYYWIQDCNQPKFTGHGNLTLNFTNIALNVFVNGTYGQCDPRWEILGEVQDLTWKMDQDLELQDLTVELESRSVGNNISILSGYVLGQARLYGLEAETQVVFNNQVGLEQITANISYTYKVVDFNASIVYNRGCTTPMKSTGTGSLLLSNVLDSTIKTDIVWNSNGSCTTTGPQWTVTASTNVDTTIKDIAVDGQADIVISGDKDHTVYGEVSVGIDFMDFESMLHVFFVNGSVTEIEIDMQLYEPGVLNLTASLQYEESCSFPSIGSSFIGTLISPAVFNETISVTGTYYKCAAIGEPEIVLVALGPPNFTLPIRNIPFLEGASLQNLSVAMNYTKHPNGSKYWAGYINGYLTIPDFGFFVEVYAVINTSVSLIPQNLEFILHYSDDYIYLDLSLFIEKEKPDTWFTGSGLLIVSNIDNSSAITVNATASYGNSTGQFMWDINGLLDSNWTIADFTVPNISVVLQGVLKQENTLLSASLEQFAWSGVLNTSAVIPEIEAFVEIYVKFDTVHGFQNITIHMNDTFAFGTIGAELLYYSNTTSVKPPTISATRCQDGGVRYLNGSGYFLSNFAYGDSVNFTTSAGYDFCTQLWTINSTLSVEMNISNLAIRDLQLFIVGYHQNTTDETLYDVIASGELVFEGIDAYASIHIAKENSYQNEAQIYISLNVTEPSFLLDVTLNYTASNGTTQAVGTGDLTIYNLIDNGSELNATTVVAYCSDPLKHGTICQNVTNQWYINGTIDGSFGIHNQDVFGLDVVLQKPGAINAASLPWNGAISAFANLSTFGVEGDVTIAFNGSHIEYFNASLTYTTDNVLIHGYVIIPSKYECDTQNMLSSGEGLAYIQNVSFFQNFEADLSWQASCNGTGYIHVKLEVEDSFFDQGFTVQRHTFGLGNITAELTRASTGQPFFFNMDAEFCGVANLQADVSFQISPLANFIVFVEYNADARALDVPRSQQFMAEGDSLLASKPGDIVGLVGRNQPGLVSSSTDLSYSQYIGTAGGDSQNTYYDMFSHATLQQGFLLFNSSASQIFANLSINLYGAECFFYFSIQSRDNAGETEFGYIAAVALDLTNIQDNAPKLLTSIKDMHFRTIMLSIANIPGQYSFDGKIISVLAGSLTINAELDFGDPKLTNFTDKQSETQRNQIGNATSGGVLTVLGEFSTDEMLLLIILSGNMYIKPVNVTQLWLSLEIDGIAAKFGFVGEATVTLGKDNSTGLPKEIVVMLQIYVELSADGAGFGIFMALCSPTNPKWEIVPDIYILFPIKFKLEAQSTPESLGIPVPTAFGIAGGFELGQDEDPVLSAYVQVYMDADNPDASSFYFQMGSFDFGKLLHFFGAMDIPSWLSNLISIGSLTIDYNMVSGSSTNILPGSNKTIAGPMAGVPSQGCDNPLALLNFEAPLYGVLIDVEDFNLADGLIVVDEAQLRIVPEVSIKALIDLEPITKIPGLQITNYDGTGGPHFELDFGGGNYLINVSGAISFLSFLHVGAYFVLNDTNAAGKASLDLGVAEIDVAFDIDLKNPLDGTFVAVNAYNLTAELIIIVDEIVNATFDALADGFQDASQALLKANQSLVEAQNALDAAKQQVDSDFGSAIADVASAQGKVDSLVSTCHYDDSKCKWYRPWMCAAAGVCWVEYGVAWTALEAAKGVLEGVQATVDEGFVVLNDALGAAEAVAVEAARLAQDASDLITAAKNIVINWINQGLSNLNVIELGASFSLYDDSSATLSFSYQIELFGTPYNGNFTCNFAWPDIGECMKPILQGFVSDILGKKSSSSSTSVLMLDNDPKWVQRPNQSLSGPIDDILNDNSLEYVNVQKNTIDLTHAVNTVPSMSNLRAIYLQDNVIQTSTPDPQFHLLDGLRIYARINGSDICSECAPHVRFSGQCHTFSCANNVSMDTLVKQIVQDINRYGNLQVTEESLKIIQIIEQSPTSSLVFLQFANSSVSLSIVEETLYSMQNSGMYAITVDSYRSCPPGRMGRTCNYYCQFGWERNAPSDGHGNFIAPSYLSMKSDDIYMHARPRCQLPLNCGGDCTSTLQRTMYTCLNFITTYSDNDASKCLLAIARANNICPQSQNERCVAPITSGFNTIYQIWNNSKTTANLGNNQKFVIHMLNPEDAYSRAVIVSIMSQISGGSVHIAENSELQLDDGYTQVGFVVSMPGELSDTQNDLIEFLSSDALLNLYDVYAYMNQSSLGVSPNFAPHIIRISPSHGPRSGNTRITIHGENFMPFWAGSQCNTSTITVGGNPCTNATWDSDSYITCITPWASTSEANNVVVTVCNKSSSGFEFNYLAPAISSISPSRLPSSGGYIQIAGEHLGDDSSAIQVYMLDADNRITFWNNVSIVVSNSLVSCIVPPGAGTQFRLVVEIVGQAAVTSPFFSYEAPTILSIEPYFAAVNQPITVCGTNFGNNASYIHPYTYSESSDLHSCTNVEIIEEDNNNYYCFSCIAFGVSGEISQLVVEVGPSEFNYFFVHDSNKTIIFPSVCEAGYYAAPDRVNGTEECRPCPEGFFTATSGQSTCYECPLGTTSLYKNASTSCVNCSAGTYDENGSCVPCATGTYTAEPGAGQCMPCDPGTFTNQTGSIDCRVCLAGTYSCAGASNCTTCEPGTYSSNDASACLVCPLGHYAPAGSAQCLECPKNTYATAKAGTCTPCPAGTFSRPGSFACL